MFVLKKLLSFLLVFLLLASADNSSTDQYSTTTIGSTVTLTLADGSTLNTTTISANNNENVDGIDLTGSRKG